MDKNQNAEDQSIEMVQNLKADDFDLDFEIIINENYTIEYNYTNNQIINKIVEDDDMKIKPINIVFNIVDMPNNNEDKSENNTKLTNNKKITKREYLKHNTFYRINVFYGIHNKKINKDNIILFNDGTTIVCTWNNCLSGFLQCLFSPKICIFLLLIVSCFILRYYFLK